MPLIHSGTDAAVSENISREVHHGKPHKQAIAIAMSIKRKYGGGSKKKKSLKSIGA